MEIPTPPTDSLYKFKALAGLILILVPLYLAYRIGSDITEQLHKSSLEAVAIQPGGVDTARRVALLDTALGHVRRSMTESYFLYALCALAVILGCSYAKEGFRQWNQKIQGPQDELLQIQLEQARLTLAKSRKEAAAAEATETPHAAVITQDGGKAP